MTFSNQPLLFRSNQIASHSGPKLLDLFAGAGGLSHGLKQAGFVSLYANEIRSSHAESYAINHPETFVDNRDIREVSASDVRKTLNLAKGELDLLAGGPPCQGFSINAPIRSSSDRRNHLFKEYLRFVEEFSPKAILIENVPGLVSFEKGQTLHSIMLAIMELGYSVDVQILYAPHFGVPQTRWRTIIIGLRTGPQPRRAFPTPTHSAPLRVNFTSHFKGRNIVAMPEVSNLKKFLTVREAIGDLPSLKNGEIGAKIKQYGMPPSNQFQESMREDSNGVLNHEAARLSRINEIRISHIPKGGNWTDIPVDLLPKGMSMARRSDHTKRYGRVDPDGLASTILTKCDPHWGAYIHYNQDRAFTVREAARIQTFPDNFYFSGSRVEQYEQVGNAVPPLLAAALGRSIGQAINISTRDLKEAV